MKFKIPFFNKKKEKNDYKSYVLYNNQFHFLNFNEPNLAIEGFVKNIITYKCISVITGQLRKCRSTLYQYNQSGVKKEIENHELLKLLEIPYPTITRANHLERLGSQYLIYGENYIQKGHKTNPGIYQNKKPIFLYSLRPDHIANIEGENHLNEEYRYTPGGKDQAINFQVTKLGKCNLMIMRKYNPQNDYHGLSPIVPAGYSIDTHNSFSKMTFNLSENGAQPTGILTIPAERKLEDHEFERIKKEMLAQSGPEQAGKPKLLEGGATWTQISINPDDMNSNETLKQQAYNIALAFNVPMELINQEQGKFTNKQEAYEQLYEDAVLPITSDYYDLLNNELVPLYGDSLRIEPDYSHTMVMRQREDNTMKKMNEINFLTANEKREVVGYESHPEGEGLNTIKPVQDKPTTELNARFIADEIKRGSSAQEAIELLKDIYG